jgi:hypothetical protein
MRDSRPKLVNFRFSEDELSALHEQWRASHQNTMSDFCRKQILEPGASGGLGTTERVLERIDRLERLARHLSAMLSPPPPRSANKHR